MALPVEKLEDCKIGDTPTFLTDFTPQIPGFSWAGTTFDAALTSVANPTDNSGALATWLGVSATINPDNSATLSNTLPIDKANKLVSNTTYRYEVQAKQNGQYVATIYTATMKAVQDYVK